MTFLELLATIALATIAAAIAIAVFERALYHDPEPPAWPQYDHTLPRHSDDTDDWPDPDPQLPPMH